VDDDSVNGYWIGYKVCWAFVFLGCWIYCITSYGFLLGVSVGWVPSAIAATVLSLLWPLILIGVAVLLWALFK
jgi:hypothetical protein